MQIYAYLCDACGHRFDSTVRSDRVRCPECGLEAKRRFSFNPRSGFQDHYNVSVGKYVRNDREFRDALKRGSEEATLRTGLEHHFEPVDAADRKEAFGITDDHMAALEPTERRRREMQP